VAASVPMTCRKGNTGNGVLVPDRSAAFDHSDLDVFFFPNYKLISYQVFGADVPRPPRKRQTFSLPYGIPVQSLMEPNVVTG